MNKLFRTVGVALPCLLSSPLTPAAAPGPTAAAALSSRDEVVMARVMQERGHPEVACTLLADTPADSVDAERLYVLARCNASLQRVDAALGYYP